MPLPIFGAAASALPVAARVLFSELLPAAATASRAVKLFRRPASLAKFKGAVKPNRLINPPKRPTSVPARYVPPERIRVPSRPTPRRLEHPGNTTPVDDSLTKDYKRPRVHKGDAADDAKTEHETPQKTDDKQRDNLGRLIAAGQALYNQGSAFIPSITWTGSVSARGFKTTSLRTVLHYCLATVFGLVHQSRIGHTKIQVDLYPNENRVDVVFENSSQILLEALNLVGAFVASNPKIKGNVKSITESTLEEIAGGKGGTLVVRKVGKAQTSGEGIPVLAGGAGLGAMAGKKLVEGTKTIQEIINFDVNEFLKKVWKRIADVVRLIGPAGIWDMAQSDIYTGRPPLSMLVPDMQPFKKMFDDTSKDHRPMLTRELAMNPQAPIVPDMHFGTHFDLRSLVAQALYDPGVMPPVPNTNVALKNMELP